MDGVKTSGWRRKGPCGRATWLLASLAALASCREHRVLCEGEGCAAAAVDDIGGAAGAPSVTDSGAGAGGAEAMPECSRDRDCDNHFYCDGVEQCVEGACEPGEAVECAYGTHCVEEGAEPCVYETSSPWLLAMTQERVLALRLAELSRDTTLVPLAERVYEPGFVGFFRAYWAPNAQSAFLSAAEKQNGTSIKLIRFGAGLPSVGDVPDLPNWGDYTEVPRFYDDSSHAQLVDRFSGTYLVDLTRDPAQTALQGNGDFARSGSSCSDGKSWLRVDGAGQPYVDNVADPTSPTRPLGSFYSVISPDRGFIVLMTGGEAEVHQVVLTRCSDDPWTLEFNDAFEGAFSPNSKLLWLQLSKGGQRVLSLEDPEAPVEVWASSTADIVNGANFSPDSRQFFFELPLGDKEPSVHAVDLSALPQPAAHDLGLAPGAQLIYTGNAAVLALDDRSEVESVRYLWQSLSVSEPPRLVFERAAGESVEISRGFLDEGSFFVERGANEQVELLKLRIDSDGFELTSLLKLEGVDIANVEMAPDHSGIAFKATTNFSDNKLYWLNLPPGGATAEPKLLLDRAVWFSFQREQP